MTAKKFAYVRVSSKDQNEERQLETMRKQGIDERDIFIDKQSGKDFDRPKYQALKNVVRAGDIIVFDSITRMGRDMNSTMQEYNYFVENGINLHFVKEPMINTEHETDDVLKQAIQKIILTLLTAFAQKEREEIKTRQAEGIANAKRKGIKLGRPVVELPENWDSLYKQWKAGNIKAVEFMEAVNMKKPTFYKKVKEYEVQ